MSPISGEAVIAWPVCYSALRQRLAAAPRFGLLGPQVDCRPLISLLALLLPLPFDVELLLLASEIRRGFAFELVPVDRQREIEGELVTHELPHGGIRQSAG